MSEIQIKVNQLSYKPIKLIHILVVSILIFVSSIGIYIFYPFTGSIQVASCNLKVEYPKPKLWDEAIINTDHNNGENEQFLLSLHESRISRRTEINIDSIIFSNKELAFQAVCFDTDEDYKTFKIFYIDKPNYEYKETSIQTLINLADWKLQDDFDQVFYRQYKFDYACCDSPHDPEKNLDGYEFYFHSNKFNKYYYVSFYKQIGPTKRDLTGVVSLVNKVKLILE